MRLPPKLPERGRYKAAWIAFNQMRELVASLIPVPAPNTLTAHTRIGTSRQGLAAGVTESSTIEIDEWEDVAYSEGDIVTRGCGGDDIDDILSTGTQAGTYIAIRDVPASTGAPETHSTYWRLAARFATHIFAVKGSGGLILIRSEDSKRPDTGAYLDMTVQEVEVCDVATGTIKYRLALVSEVYEKT